jgi:hypothetical protein
LRKNLEEFTDLERDLPLGVHFLSRERKRTKRKRPCHGVVLRVADTDGARGNSPACGGLRQSARFFRPYR